MSRRAGFVGLMVAEAISLFGSRMAFLALPWLVLVTTGSATLTGVVTFAEMLPYVLVNAVGGPLVDRLGARRTSIGMDAASVAVVGTVPALYAIGALHFGVLVVLVAVAGLLRGLGDSGKRLIFPQVARDSGTELTRATAVQDGVSRGATLIGAPLAGVLVAFLGAPGVLVLDAVTFGVAAVLVRAFVPRPAGADPDPATTEPAAGERPVRESYISQLREGVAWVRRDPLILGTMVMLFLTNLIDQAQGAVFVPVWAREFGTPMVLGLVSGSFALGAVLGNLVYAAVAPRLPRYAPFAIGFLIGGCPRLFALAFDAPLWSIITISVTAGIALSTVNPILGAVYYERIPPTMQARVLGLSIALSWAGIPIGSLLGGWLVDSAGLRTALLISAGGYLLATLMPFTSRHWRAMDERPAAVADPARA